LILLINNKYEKRLYNEKLDFNDNLKFSKITFILGENYKPHFFITLDSLGNIFSEDKISVRDNTITRNFKLTSAEINSIDSLFKFSCIDKTDTAGWNCWWCCDDCVPMLIKFEYNNKTTIIKTYEFTKMPYRIWSIYWRITKILFERENS